jgi:hypothetical protein
MATKRHRPKKPATNQPDDLPEAINQTPPAANTIDTSRVKNLRTIARAGKPNQRARLLQCEFSGFISLGFSFGHARYKNPVQTLT